MASCSDSQQSPARQGTLNESPSWQWCPDRAFELGESDLERQARVELAPPYVAGELQRLQERHQAGLSGAVAVLRHALDLGGARQAFRLASCRLLSSGSGARQGGGHGAAQLGECRIT